MLIDSNKGAKGPSLASPTTLSESRRVSLKLRAFLGHSARSAISKDLERNDLKGNKLLFMKRTRKAEGLSHLQVNLRRFSGYPFHNERYAIWVELDKARQNELKPWKQLRGLQRRNAAEKLEGFFFPKRWIGNNFDIVSLPQNERARHFLLQN